MCAFLIVVLLSASILIELFACVLDGKTDIWAGETYVKKTGVRYHVIIYMS
jgi:hypothetical protein